MPLGDRLDVVAAVCWARRSDVVNAFLLTAHDLRLFVTVSVTSLGSVTSLSWVRRRRLSPRQEERWMTSVMADTLGYHGTVQTSSSSSLQTSGLSGPAQITNDLDPVSMAHPRQCGLTSSVWPDLVSASAARARSAWCVVTADSAGHHTPGPVCWHCPLPWWAP